MRTLRPGLATTCLTLTVVATLIVVALGACGQAGKASTPGGGWPAGRTFLSISVTENGTQRPLVTGTRISVNFTGTDKVGASAGCNSMGGTARIEGGKLVVTDLATTDMGCEQPRMDQDTWFGNFLTSHPALSLAGDELVLSSSTIEIRFTDQRIVDPDRPLAGTRWSVDTIIRGEAASSVPAGASAYLVFSATTVDGSTGCQNLSGPVTVLATTIVFPTQGVAGASAPSCDAGRAALHAAVVAALRGNVAYTIRGPRLTLTGPGGAGLGLHATTS
jgi:heat shock protein HslJ